MTLDIFRQAVVKSPDNKSKVRIMKIGLRTDRAQAWARGLIQVD